MSIYNVSVPVGGLVHVSVNAKDEAEAIERTYEKMSADEFNLHDECGDLSVAAEEEFDVHLDEPQSTVSPVKIGARYRRIVDGVLCQVMAFSGRDGADVVLATLEGPDSGVTNILRLEKLEKEFTLKRTSRNEPFIDNSLTKRGFNMNNTTASGDSEMKRFEITKTQSTEVTLIVDAEDRQRASDMVTNLLEAADPNDREKYDQESTDFDVVETSRPAPREQIKSDGVYEHIESGENFRVISVGGFLNDRDENHLRVELSHVGGGGTPVIFVWGKQLFDEFRLVDVSKDAGASDRVDKPMSLGW